MERLLGHAIKQQNMLKKPENLPAHVPGTRTSGGTTKVEVGSSVACGGQTGQVYRTGHLFAGSSLVKPFRKQRKAVGFNLAFTAIQG